MFIKSNLLKIGGVTASLVSALAMATPSFALNPTIGNNLTSDTFSNSIGQTFINDPSGTGTFINLNSWTFGLGSDFDVLLATRLSSNLSIYLGNFADDGVDTNSSVIGSSRTTSLAPVSGIVNPVTWNFAGGLQLKDNVTYSAVILGDIPLPLFIQAAIRGNTSNPYPNGAAIRIVGNSVFAEPELDTVFRGNFSTVASTPVPFEFSPVLGLSILGGIASFRVGSRLIKKAKAAKNA